MPILHRSEPFTRVPCGTGAYGVLGRVSAGYPPVEGRLHTCYSPVRRSPSGKASFSHAAPRLACVRPVASVHPEPGSNSSLLYSRFFFSLDKKPRAVAGMRDFCLGYRPTTSRPLSGPRPIYCCLFLTCRELDMELGFPFLVSCTVNSSSDCKHFKDRATLPFWRQKNRSLNSSSREAKSLQNYCHFSKHASVSRFFFADHPIFLPGWALSRLRMQRYNLFLNRQTFSALFFKKIKKITPLQEKAAPHLIIYTRASRRGPARAQRPQARPPDESKKLPMHPVIGSTSC